MNEQIDWKALALQLGLLRKDGESGGSHSAKEALEILLGKDNLRDAVDYYVSGRHGSELARSVLWLIRPWSAMIYCYEIYKSDRKIQDRRAAVELLRVVADKRALAWVGEFFEDDDPEIQMWGVGLLDQLLFSGLVETDEAEHLLKRAESHANINVREQAESIRAFVTKTESQNR